METINDIIAEMRKDIPRVVDTKVILRNYADRIEAAHKREREATCEKSSQVGNAAKMREALLKSRKTMDEMSKSIFQGWIEDSLVDVAGEAQRAISSALSAPVRNCDLYATEGEAYKAYLTAMKNETKETYMYFEPWLFAETKGDAE